MLQAKVWNAVQMNNEFYVEVYKHRYLIMYNVMQVYRILCSSLFKPARYSLFIIDTHYTFYKCFPTYDHA